MKLTPAKVAELRALNLPRLKYTDVMKVTEGHLTPDEEKSLNEYFSKFVELPKTDAGEAKCLGCDHIFCEGELMIALLSGGPGRTRWKWSIVHGECQCARCGWPARALHYDVGKTATGEVIFKNFSVVLVVHPEELRFNET
jgi:hypothetical protein